MMPKRRNVVAGISLVAFAMLSLAVSYNFFTSHPAYYYNVNQEIVGQVHEKGTLRTHLVISRYMPDDCLLIVNRLFYRENDGEVVFSQIVPALVTTNVENKPQDTAVDMPPSLMVGDYVIHTRIDSSCSEVARKITPLLLVFKIEP
jgi:hypothetical protein